MNIFKLVTKFTLIFFGASCYADLVVDESIVIFTDLRQSKHDVTVYNTDEASKLFLEVLPHRVIEPGTDQEKLEALDFSSAPDFLVSPNRAILEPNSRSIIRLLNLNTSGAKELVYRVNVVPATPPVAFENPESEDVRSMLQVVIAYQILVIVLPENPETVVDYTRAGDSVMFSNPGNVNYLLTDGEQCNPADPGECFALESRRIYPGNLWTLDLPFSGPAKYTIRTHQGSSSRIIN